MKVAIIGSGVSGLMAAKTLYSKGCDFTVYELNDYIGGHVRTLRLPFSCKDVKQDSIIFPIELGVVMLDPQGIHPYLYQLVQEYNLELKPFFLDFTFANEKYQINWTTQSKHGSRLIRNLYIGMQTFRTNLSVNGIKHIYRLFSELLRFSNMLSNICLDKQYQHISLSEFLERQNFSTILFDAWLYPQLLCWWGITKEHVLSTNIQVIADSMYKSTININAQYTIAKGWDTFICKLSQDFDHRIHTTCKVHKIFRSKDKVTVTTETNQEIFDAVVLAVAPNIASKLIQDKTLIEETLLNKFTTTVTRVYLHTDDRVLSNTHPWSTMNFFSDNNRTICTYWVGRGDQLHPNIFLSWGDNPEELLQQNKIIMTTDWVRTLPSVDYSCATHDIAQLQGNKRTWYCGAHVDALSDSGTVAIASLWLDNALKSGVKAAQHLYKQLDL